MLKPEERAGAWVLVREVGVWRALRIGIRIRRQASAGEPFAGAGLPNSPRERSSRAQIGPAILIYRELREYVTADEAFRITERLAVEGGVRFLRRTIGPLTSETLENLTPAARRAFVRRKGEAFFNAKIKWDKIEEREVHFTVTSCHFPRLCKLAGAPELAPIFCKSDAKFFGTVEPNVSLIRPQTIADGGPCCLFELRWVDDP